MKCPHCGNEILDTTVICPYCNTQFAFSAPSSFNNSTENGFYEVSKVRKFNDDDNGNVSAYNSVTLPTEPIINNDEEIDPHKMSYYVNEKPKNDEIMHIAGKPIDEPINPSEFGSPSITMDASNQQSNISQNSTQIPVVNNPSVVEQINFADNIETNAKVDGNQDVVTQQQINNEIKQTTNIDNTVSVQTNIEVQQAPVIESSNNNINYSSIVYAQPKFEKEGSTPIEKKKKKADEMFFMSVIGAGVIIIGLLLIFMILKNNKNPIENTDVNTITTKYVQSENVGGVSNFDSPLDVGYKVLSSIYNKNANGYEYVDVVGDRFIKGIEAQQLADTYTGETLKDGWEWNAFEYTVLFNDLSNIEKVGLSPILDAKVYMINGYDFIVYNEHNYLININTVYDGGNINNHESATIKIIYQLPIDQKDYSICFGSLSKTLGCFKE